MSKVPNNKSNTVGICSVIIVLVAIIGIVTSSVSMLATYPTPNHRTVIRQFNELNRKAQQGDFKKVLESAEYKELQATPEMSYSVTASIIATIIETILGVAIIGYIYYYLRRSRLVKKATAATTWLYVLGSSLVIPVVVYLESAVVTQRPPELVDTILIIIANLTIGTAITYLVARLFKWNYDRKHSFAVE
jgi:hypothetical protein